MSSGNGHDIETGGLVDNTEKQLSGVPTRGELDAKIDASEARLGTTLEKLQGEISVGFSSVNMGLGELKTSHNRVMQSISNVKWQLPALILSVMAILLTMFLFWQQGMLLISNILKNAG